jgi:hypothetical protein
MSLHRSGIGCTFQGQFPVKDIGEDGFAGIASKSFPPMARRLRHGWQHPCNGASIGLARLF